MTKHLKWRGYVSAEEACKSNNQHESWGELQANINAMPSQTAVQVAEKLLAKKDFADMIRCRDLYQSNFGSVFSVEQLGQLISQDAASYRRMYPQQTEGDDE